MMTIITTNQGRCYSTFINKVMVYQRCRWVLALSLLLIYLMRGLTYYVVSYLIGFYLVQLLINYFIPQGMDEFEQLQIQNNTRQSQFSYQFNLDSYDSDSKPLLHSLNETQVWLRVCCCFIVGIFLTTIQWLEMDVFWPLLLVYFICLVLYTVHKIVVKMETYGYNQNNFNKKSSFLI